ncbi:MAG: hypothetical protein LBC03_07400 [Nitrososphaerota archaeon]|jgi:hypothetical protein|nr:hypothetical protein [Nitrososphaerota archaeon]
MPSNIYQKIDAITKTFSEYVMAEFYSIKRTASKNITNEVEIITNDYKIHRRIISSNNEPVQLPPDTVHRFYMKQAFTIFDEFLAQNYLVYLTPEGVEEPIEASFAVAHRKKILETVSVFLRRMTNQKEALFLDSLNSPPAPHKNPEADLEGS